MFKKGQFIIYGNRGICVVEDITKLSFEVATKEKDYYVLNPYMQPEGKIYVPVDSCKTKMRAVITKDDAMELIDSIPEIELISSDNDKQRELQYKECIRSCDCKEWVRIIKTLYLRMQQRTEEGKKITATDERYFKTAEDSLYAELSLALKIPKEDMEGYISQRCAPQMNG